MVGISIRVTKNNNLEEIMWSCNEGNGSFIFYWKGNDLFEAAGVNFYKGISPIVTHYSTYSDTSDIPESNLKELSYNYGNIKISPNPTQISEISEDLNAYDNNLNALSSLLTVAVKLSNEDLDSLIIRKDEDLSIKFLKENVHFEIKESEGTVKYYVSGKSIDKSDFFKNLHNKNVESIVDEMFKKYSIST